MKIRALEMIETTLAARGPKLVQDLYGPLRLCASSVIVGSRISGEKPDVARTGTLERSYPKESEAVLQRNDSEASSGGRRDQALMIAQTILPGCAVADE